MPPHRRRRARLRSDNSQTRRKRRRNPLHSLLHPTANRPANRRSQTGNPDNRHKASQPPPQLVPVEKLLNPETEHTRQDDRTQSQIPARNDLLPIKRGHTPRPPYHLRRGKESLQRSNPARIRDTKKRPNVPAKPMGKTRRKTRPEKDRGTINLQDAGRKTPLAKMVLGIHHEIQSATSQSRMGRSIRSHNKRGRRRYQVNYPPLKWEACNYARPSLA